MNTTVEYLALLYLLKLDLQAWLFYEYHVIVSHLWNKIWDKQNV